MAIQLTEKGYERLQSVIPFGFGFAGRPNVNGTVYRNMAVLFLLIAQLIIWLDSSVAMVLACILIIEGLMRDLFGTHCSFLYLAVNGALKRFLTPLAMVIFFGVPLANARRYALALHLEGDTMAEKADALKAQGVTEADLAELERIERTVQATTVGVKHWARHQFGVLHLNETTSNYMKKRLLDRMLWIIGSIVLMMLVSGSQMYIVPMLMMSILALLEILIGFCLPCWVAEAINRNVEIQAD